MSNISAAWRVVIAGIAAFLLTSGVCVSSAYAETPMTAGVAHKNMSAREFHAFTAGIAEGLAYARYQRDGVEGMKCVLEWFYKSGNSARHIDQAFTRFADHYPSNVMAALINRQCGV